MNSRWEQHQQHNQLSPSPTTFLPVHSTRLLGNGPTASSGSQTNLFAGSPKSAGIHLILDKRKWDEDTAFPSLVEFKTEKQRAEKGHRDGHLWERNGVDEGGQPDFCGRRSGGEEKLLMPWKYAKNAHPIF
jgi:hypothetical protein